MNKNWIASPKNKGGNSWLLIKSGIPAIEPTWSVSRVGRAGLMSDLCAYDDCLYVKSGFETISYSIANGNELWRDKPSPSNKASNCYVKGKYLCSGWYIYEKDTGKIKTNFIDGLEENSLFKYGYIAAQEDHFYREIESPESNICALNINGQSGFLGIGLSGIVQDNDNHIYGWVDNNICCYDMDSKKIKWNLETPTRKNGTSLTMAGFSCANNKIYIQLKVSLLWCVDALTGEIIWQHNEPEGTVTEVVPNYGVKQADIIAVCDDRIYLGSSRQDDGWIECFNEKDGESLWKKDVKDLMSLCIVGDLLFGIKEQFLIVAWDRYTGEEVWQAKDPMTAAYHVIAAGNKVIYSSTTGELRCYEWTEIYNSPAKQI